MVSTTMRVSEAVRGAAEVLVTLLASPLVRSRYNRWGADDAEVRASMPGDDLVPRPRLTSTRAVTVDAPPEAVWPWLAQIGQGRGGLYSYDALENLVGLDIHSADEILPEHQQLSAGDVVRLGREGSPCFRVVSVDAGRSLVMVAADPTTQQAVQTPVLDGPGATWQWLLQPLDDGRSTRVISRQRNAHPRRQHLLWRLVEPVGFVMERRMLLGVQERAERSVAAHDD
ncbi:MULTISPECIES: SRPBCC family protein [unclassified Ornithinimicrobium]|uniref:SRPBCC family protein n=1 Tax=unclassified Ornithinimicrobium TaxID=2615080 RepID=UPI003851EB65